MIEGIRGTGKTHILKMISEKCLSNYSSRKILPVYVSLASVSEWIESDIRFFRIHFYAHIVQSAILTIENNRKSIELAGNGKAKTALKKIAQMFGFNENEMFECILDKIRTASSDLIEQLIYNPSEIVNSLSNYTKGSVNTGIAFSQANMKINYEEGEDSRQAIKHVGNSLASENSASFIVNFLSELKDVLGNEYTYILVDECSEVCEKAQKEVFRLFKLIRGGFSEDLEKNSAYFCGTVYPTPMTHYPSKAKGDSFNFQCGHDAIMEYLSLDELSDEYLDFYKEITNKRIDVILKGDSEISTYNNIFESDKAIVMAAYLSNGNVRRYIEILKHSYDKLCRRISESPTDDISRISVKDVEESIALIVQNQILTTDSLRENDLYEIDKIIAKITKRNKKNETENSSKNDKDKLPANVYFTVSRGELIKLGNLVMQGALHDKNKTRIKKYYKEEGSRGPLLMLDLAVAFNDSAILRTRAYDIFINDLKKNAKSGYLWCQDFRVDE